MRVLIILYLFTLLHCEKSKDESKSMEHKDDKLHLVKLSVYYESLCTDCKIFFTVQLEPAWREFGYTLILDLVPYGLTIRDRMDCKWIFLCHHGKSECRKNKLQACVIKDTILREVEKMDLIFCLMNNVKANSTLRKCLKKIYRPKEEKRLNKCAAGPQGDQLLFANGETTDAIQKPLLRLPTIVVNDKFDTNIQDMAIDNLRSVILNFSKIKLSSSKVKMEKSKILNKTPPKGIPIETGPKIFENVPKHLKHSTSVQPRKQQPRLRGKVRT